ncbi:MAG: hypothetical protein R3E82_11390 [Pseudomonadales bacterium]|nr:hypothetical protein [Pseudomonadales bacterium]
MSRTTHAELAVHLLRDAAGFFRNVAEQNPHMSEQLNDNAAVYEQVADLLTQDPLATIDWMDDDE